MALKPEVESVECSFCRRKPKLEDQIISCRNCLDYLEVEGKKEILSSIEKEIKLKERELEEINSKIKFGLIHPKYQKVQLNAMRADVYDELRWKKDESRYLDNKIWDYRNQVNSLQEFIDNLAPLLKKKQIIENLRYEIKHLQENKDLMIKNIDQGNAEYDRVQLEFYSKSLIEDIEPRYYFPPESKYSQGILSGWVQKDRDAFTALLRTSDISNRGADPKFIHAIKRDPKTCEICSRRAIVRATYQASGGYYSIPLCAHCIITKMRKTLNEYFYKLFKLFY